MDDLTLLASALVLATTITYLVSPLLAKPAVVTEGGPPQGRRQALLERKAMLYQSIRDAELDRHTGKLSEGDYEEMVGGLKRQAADLIRELDRLAQASDEGSGRVRGPRRRGR